MRLLALTLLSLASLLSFAQAETFAEFMTTHSLTGSDATPTADPDNDRVPNLLEFALDGMDPTVSDSAHASMPQMVFMRRIGTELGQWEYAGSTPPTDGVDGIFHSALLYRPRPGVVGIRFIPKLADTSTLLRWFDGCSALRSEALPSGEILSVSITQGQRYKRFFMRLEVLEDEGLVDPLAGFTVNGQAGLALIPSEPVSVPRVISGGTTTTATTQDMTVTRTSGATTVTDWRWTYTASPFNLESATVTRSADPANLTPASDPFLWTWVANGSTQLTLSTPTSTYRRIVTNATATGQTVDVWASNVSGTFRAAADSSIDARITGTSASTSAPLWSARTPGTPLYVRSSACWASTVDLTPHSAYNSITPAYQPGLGGCTLISPRHVIGAAHTGQPQAGATYHFVKSDGTVCIRTCTASARVGTTDILIGILASDVDSGISFARVLPDTWAAKLPTLSTRRVACARITRQQKLSVHELLSLTSETATFTLPSGTRSSFGIEAESGDSGTPLFFIADNQMILIGALFSKTSAPSIIGQRATINAAMTTLGGSYQLTDADLTSFTSF